MLNRRTFLRLASATAAVGCTPLIADAREVSALESPLQQMKRLSSQAHFMLGYPVNMTTPPRAFFEWRDKLAEVGVDRFAFNNVGNPYVKSHFPFQTHELEREAISRFAKLYGFAPKSEWGFLSHSGTDSNMHGMYMGRTILKNRTGKLPKAYFTKEAHYSIQILRDLLGLEWIEVDTNLDGSMDPRSLERQLAKHSGDPALVIATTGTTFKGAVDSVTAIRAILCNRVAYLHLDAALFGGYLPHTKFAEEVSLAAEVHPTKRTPRYDSLAVSCHKFFGFPSPAGLFLTTKHHFEEFQHSFQKVHDPSYIHQVPGTITCSRDAVKPAEFYFFSSESAFARQREDAQNILENTEYLRREMKTHYPDLRPRRANEMSNIVYFRSPGPNVVHRYTLATTELEMERKAERFAHVVVMPHATRAILDRFLEDLKPKD